MTSMDYDYLQRSVQAFHERVRRLYQRSQSETNRDAILGDALEEIGVALDLLQATRAACDTWHNEQMDAKNSLEIELQRYRDLFEYAPAAYIVTSPEGTIQQVNAIARTLFGGDDRELIGRSLTLFVPSGSRRAFATMIRTIPDVHDIQPHTLHIQPIRGTPCTVASYVQPRSKNNGRIHSLWWTMHNTSMALSF